jgi:hypothetical protein
VQHVAFAPLPPVHAFPGLPQPLRWVAGADAGATTGHCGAGPARGDDVLRGHAHAAGPRVHGGDGFHPGGGLPLLRRGHRQHIATQVWPASLRRKPRMTRSLQGKTLVITGASRGIGLAIARRAAADGANIVLLAKTVDPNPKLPGTLASAAAEVEAAGGQALPVQTDIRDEAAVAAVVQAAVALRRHRHPGQQRQRHQPDADAGHADEALRPDVRRQRARHLLPAPRPACPS